MRSRSNGGIIGAYALPTQNYANGVFFIHDAAIYNTGANPIWPLAAGLIYSATGGTISTAVDNSNYKTHTFTANGTFTVTTGAGLMEIFLVGGGGAGGAAYAPSGSYDVSTGGGGAGGAVLLATQVWVKSGTVFTVEVGQGGASMTGAQGGTTASIGKPSKVTSNYGHSYTAPGGGYGGAYTGATYTSPVSGGGHGVYYGGSTDRSPISRTDASGGPGVLSFNSAVGQLASVGLTSDSFAATRGGGGAGWTDGYAGSYSTNLNLSGNGGEAYLYSRTGYYYGGGGPGGTMYFFPAGQTNDGYSNRSGQYASGSRYNAAFQYANGGGGGSINGGSGVNGYGNGGGGTAIGPVSSTTTSTSGSGGAGTVIFCYRYK